MRTFKLISVLVLLAMVLSACGGAAAPASTEIKVAVLAPLSGSQPTFGAMTRDGALLAIEEYSKAHNGGVIGKTIKAIIEDSQCSPDPAVIQTLPGA